MFKFTIEQIHRDGRVWHSQTLEKRRAGDVRQVILAGFVPGEPRKAISSDGRVLYALDGTGRTLIDNMR